MPVHAGPETYYNLLTTAFLGGHLYLPVVPPPELLAAKNPFGVEGVGRLQDASLYNGRFYLYYGPTPALTLFLPWRIASGRAMPHSFAVLVYAMAGYVFSCLLLFVLLEAAEIRASLLLKGAAVMALGLGNLTPVLIRRPGAVYEVAITAGFCFFMAAMYFLARGVTTADKPWTLAVAGLCTGLAAGCRPHYAVVAVLVLAMYAVYMRRLGKDLLYFGAPIVFCGLALAWYNFARFDSPFEFGTKYQLTGNSIAHVMLHARHVVPTLYFYLFSPPLWMDQFPFLQLMRQAPAPFGHPEWMPWINLEEEFAGILTVAPLCAAGLLLPLALLRKNAAEWRPVKLVVFALWAAAVTMLTSIAFAGSIAMRYHPDYAPELLVAALFVCVWAAAAARTRAVRVTITALTVAGCVWGAGCTMALSVNSYNHSLRTRNPEEFKKLVSLFGGNPEKIRYPVRQLKFGGTITFEGSPASRREAILSSGGPHAGDVVFVEYIGEGKLRFGAEHWGWPVVTGPVIDYAPSVPLALEVDYERTDYGRLTIELNGQPALFRQGEMYFTAPGEVAAGQDKRGSPPLAPFSGRLQVKGGISLGFGE